MPESLQQSWVILVYGRKRRKPRQIEEEISPCSPVEWVEKPYKHRHSWRPRNEPPIMVAVKADRHDIDFLRELKKKAREAKRLRGKS